MAKVVLDQAKCTGIGICESIADKYFEVNDDGELLLLSGGDIEEADLDVVRAAVAGCPVAALSLHETD